MATKPHHVSFHANIVSLTLDSSVFRRVVFTTGRTQIVTQTLDPGEEIGAETHDHTEQILFCVAGRGEVVLNGVHSPFVPGDVVVVPPGVRHNFVNTGRQRLRLFTVYAPPNHLPGRVHATKEEAEADVEDEAVESGRASGSPPDAKRIARVKDRLVGNIAGHAIWLVSGRTVRDTLDVDFTTGGNPGRYVYVPDGEIWIEASMSPADVAATIVHELVELAKMLGDHESYDAAHDDANVVEKEARARLRGRSKEHRRTAPKTREQAVAWARRFLRPSSVE
jgi:mannose-6-phosphate isomerase-like protein (cupin superfamily)